MKKPVTNRMRAPLLVATLLARGTKALVGLIARPFAAIGSRDSKRPTSPSKQTSRWRRRLKPLFHVVILLGISKFVRDLVGVDAAIGTAWKAGKELCIGGRESIATPFVDSLAAFIVTTAFIAITAWAVLRQGPWLPTFVLLAVGLGHGRRFSSMIELIVLLALPISIPCVVWWPGPASLFAVGMCLLSMLYLRRAMDQRRIGIFAARFGSVQTAFAGTAIGNSPFDHHVGHFGHDQHDDWHDVDHEEISAGAMAPLGSFDGQGGGG